MESDLSSIWKDGSRPTPGRAVKLEQQLLMQALGFSLEDLEINRRGRLAGGQRKRLMAHGIAPVLQGIRRLFFMLAFILAIGVLLGASSGLGLAKAVDLRFVGLLFLYPLTGVVRTIGRMRVALPDILKGEVDSVQGRVYATQRARGSLDSMTDGQDLHGDTGLLGHEAKTQRGASDPHRRYYAEVDGVEFEVPEPLFRALQDDSNNLAMARAFYAPRTAQLLSMEPLTILPKKSLPSIWK